MQATIGETLRAARTAKHLTIKQVWKALHIKDIYLEAIEQDNLAGLPSPVQAKGFIRLYWDYLGLDEQDLVKFWTPIVPEVPALQETAVEASNGDAGIESTDATSSTNILTQIQDKLPETLKRPRKTTKKETAKPIEEAVQVPVVPIKAERISDRSFKQVGEQLRKQRERMSLSIAAIEAYTHISQQYLNALEAGEIEKLPSPVQGRGMLSNYADFLDMDTENLLLTFAEGLQLRREESLAESKTPAKRIPPKFKKPTLAGSFFSFEVLIVGGLIIVSLIGMIWGASSIFSYQQRPKVPPTSIPISAVLINTDIPTAVTETVTATMTPSPVSAAPITEGESPQITGTTSITVGPSTGFPVQILIVALKRAFIQVSVDGKIAFNGRVIPGNPYSFNALNQIELITGNAGAIQVIYNQTDMGALGLQSEVVHLVFSSKEYGTPTLTPTPTATNTIRPTRTPRPSNTYPPTRTPRPSATLTLAAP